MNKSKAKSAKFFEKKFHQKKSLVKASARTQSAMEYLMTYGWAILIIAVVLTVLFSMGITNPLFFAPKATAGSCQEIRTSVGPSLEGICNGGIPKFVAEFNGQSSTVLVSQYTDLNASYITITAWINPSSYNCNSDHCIIVNKENQYELALADGSGYLNGAFDTDWAWFGGSNAITIGQWSFVAVTWDGTTQKYYVNGEEVYNINAGSGALAAQNSCFRIGARNGCGSPGSFFPGSISNVQMYNTSLSQNAIEALYQEGIGGAPIDLQHLVGWWPLNGNANDYSGNNNDGTASNVIWSGTWWQGYNQP